MNRRDLFRTTLIGALSAAVGPPHAAARDFPPGFDASKELERSDWKPVFLDDHQNQTLASLCDLIVPGAKEAFVNRFLDLLMSVEKTETQRAFQAALSFIDGACIEQYGSAFVHVPREQQMDFLHLIAYPHTHETWGEESEPYPGNDHFEKLKEWISGAYYSSPAGLKEIGWDGTFPHGQFSGCGHSSEEHMAHTDRQ